MGFFARIWGKVTGAVGWFFGAITGRRSDEYDVEDEIEDEEDDVEEEEEDDDVEEEEDDVEDEEEAEEYDFPSNVIFVRSETPPSTTTKSFRGVFFFASDAAEYAAEIGTTVLIVEYNKTFFLYVLGSDDDEPYPI